MTANRRRALALFGGAVFALPLAEGAARLLTPAAGEELLFNAPAAAPAALYRDSETLLLEPNPGFNGTISSLGYSVFLRINTLGLRGPEVGPGRTWLALGDSFTMAAQVAEESTFEGRLGDHLGVSVLNAGVDGYSTWQGTLRYRALDDITRAEGVLLMYFLGNDLSDNQRIPAMLHGPRPPGGHAAVQHDLDPVTHFLFSHSVLYAYGRVAWKRHQMAAGDDFDSKRFRQELQIFSRDGRPELERLLPSTDDALLELRDETRRRGDPLLVAVAPPSFAVDPAMATRLLDLFHVPNPDVDAPRRAVLASLGRLDIHACDLTPPLAAAISRGEKPYFRFDGHWTAAGHAIVADTLAGCLAQSADHPDRKPVQPTNGAVNGSTPG